MATNAGNHGEATPERQRLAEDARRIRNWKRWGTYLPERQWGTVREDYSADGDVWNHFPHDHARSRAYRWGEDGLLGWCDRQGRLCFALALWNGHDPILKERLFGLTGSEGNHGEDVKEEYFYLDATPTHSYCKALYKYPQRAFPYVQLIEENRRRGREQPEYELADTGIFEGGRYFDVFVEYCKAGPEDTLIQITAHNRGPEPAPLHLLPTLWFRNTWSWGRTGEGYSDRPRIQHAEQGGLLAEHQSLLRYRLVLESLSAVRLRTLFTDNETNLARLFGGKNKVPHVKDAFHELIVRGKQDAVDPARRGTKAAFWCEATVPAGQAVVLRLRLCPEADLPKSPFGAGFGKTLARAVREADQYYDGLYPPGLTDDERRIARQTAAGLLWSKQFFHYSVREWLEGDPAQPPPPQERRQGRNADWTHLYNRDVISMPDKWEYPWYAAWDLAFHMLPFARLDPSFAKEQLILFLREWYMHPSGQLPAYEFALGDVNPPVHAWACWRVYKMTGARGKRDLGFLKRAFQKLLINFTWWVNRKDVDGKHLFSGGFLGLDNIGVFDRSKPLPAGGRLQQADGTAWMAFYCATMLSIALELARFDESYEDVASKFFEHFVAIADATNTLGGSGLWDEKDGFYYDQVLLDGQAPIPLRVRSLVGLIPLLAVEVLEEDVIARLPGFKKRMQWFLDHRQDLAHVISCAEPESGIDHRHRLLAIPSCERLVRVLGYLLDEQEFLSPYGIRSLSKVHERQPYVLALHGGEHRVDYAPGESTTTMFGGNSNWRGPIWFPLNFLLIEALERYHHFWGDALQVEFPTGSGKKQNLAGVALAITQRLASLFTRDAHGRRPCAGGDSRFAQDPHWKDLVLLHEYFHAETGKGLGASHQTGWTALVLGCLAKLARARAGG
jgi:hypothetical protein